MRLVDEWRHAWKWWSVRLNLLGNVLLAAMLAFPPIAQDIWVQLPDDLKAHLPTRIAYWIPVALFLASALARIIKQGGKDGQ